MAPLPDPDTKLHRMWVKSYLHSRQAFWGLFTVLLGLISFAQDSIARDFALLFGVITLGGLAIFRELALKCIVAGRVEERLSQSGLGPQNNPDPQEDRLQNLPGLLH